MIWSGKVVITKSGTIIRLSDGRFGHLNSGITHTTGNVRQRPIMNPAARKAAYDNARFAWCNIFPTAVEE